MDNYSFTVENHGIHSFLVYCVAPEEHLDATSLGMLTNNKIPGLATTLYTQIDTTKYVKYNISTKIPLKQLLAGKINKKRLITIFSDIVSAMISTEEYMLDIESIILDPDYIFTDNSTYETELICLPISHSKEREVDLRMFFKNIMVNVQYDSTEDFTYFAKIMNYLNSAPVFSLEAFNVLLSEIKNEVKIQKSEVGTMSERANSVSGNALKEQEVVGQKIETNTDGINSFFRTIEEGKEECSKSNEKQISLFYLLQHYNKENAALYKAQTAAKKKAKESAKLKNKNDDKKTDLDSDLDFMIPGQPVSVENIHQIDQSVHKKAKLEIVQQKEITPQVISREMDFGATIILDDDNDDTVYIENEDTWIRPYLLRQKTGEKIDIDKELFCIGRSKNDTDYQITDNQAVGRKHAYIKLCNNEYYIVDLNSKNYTFVNGIKLQKNEEVKLSNGDIVHFANEEFEFFINE